MTRTELYQNIPRLRDIYALVQQVEFVDAVTSLLSSKGYTVKFYHEFPHLWQQIVPYDNFAAVTMTMTLEQSLDEGLNITLYCPASENADELSLYAVVVMKEHRDTASSYLQAHRLYTSDSGTGYPLVSTELGLNYRTLYSGLVHQGLIR